MNKKAVEGRAALRAVRPRAGRHDRRLDDRVRDAVDEGRQPQLLADWGQDAPTLIVVSEAEETLGKSFRNLDRVLVTVPSEVEVDEVVWARSLLVSEAALPLVRRALRRRQEAS